MSGKPCGSDFRGPSGNREGARDGEGVVEVHDVWRAGLYKTMSEVGGALIAMSLVLCAVFVPTAFITGISGAFYRQFALTIAASTLISLLVSLTISPALSALLLKAPKKEEQKPGSSYWPILRVEKFFHGFNWWLDKLSDGYGSCDVDFFVTNHY